MFMITFSGAEASTEKKPYLAVFCNPGNFVLSWVHYKPDLIYTACDWNQLDDFLKLAKERAHGRHIDLDIEAHGSRYLTLQYMDNCTGTPVTKHATMGYVLNHVEKVLGTKNFTLIFEACYGGYVYKHTIRDNKPAEAGEDVLIEDHKGVPTYPIFGGSYSCMNINNFIYLQYKSHMAVVICDLRYWENHTGPARDSDQNSVTHKHIAEMWDVISSFYDPNLSN